MSESLEPGTGSPRDTATGASTGPATPSPGPTGEPAPIVDGYSDFVFVARGGDSIVYRAHDDALDRDVAIKVVLLDDPESIARFRRELAITVRLGRQHPNILTVLATSTTTTGQPCLVTDYVELGSLQHRLAERGRLPVSEVVTAGSVVADALSFAHAQGVLHRDVKPQNILVLPTSYLLADFGLARAIDAGHSASLERFSYRHASPRILDGEAPTTADDVYSLGSTLFTLLDGRPPFAADDPDDDTALSYLRRARTGAPRPLPDDVPTQLAAIVQRCLARSRDERFPDAAALRRALDDVPSENRSWAPRPHGRPIEPVDGPQSMPAAATHEPSTPPEAPPADAATEAPADGSAAAAAIEPDSPIRPASYAPSVPSADAGPARSALARLAREQPPRDLHRDAEPTGLRPEPADSERAAGDSDRSPRHAGPDDEPPTRTPRRWPWLVAAAVVALVVGLVLGLRNGGGTDRGDTARPTPRTSETTHTASQGTSQSQHLIPTAAATSIPPTSQVSIDPSLRPRITTMRREGSRLELAWSDPSRGRLPFIVFFAEPGNATARVATDKGITRASIPDFPAGRHCLLVSTVDTSPTTPVYGRGPTRCIDG